jgi:hypothetical protein
MRKMILGLVLVGCGGAPQAPDPAPTHQEEVTRTSTSVDAGPDAQGVAQPDASDGAPQPDHTATCALASGERVVVYCYNGDGGLQDRTERYSDPRVIGVTAYGDAGELASICIMGAPGAPCQVVWSGSGGVSQGSVQ